MIDVPVNKSVLHFLIFLEITSGVSSKLIRELSFSALLDILLVPSFFVVVNVVDWTSMMAIEISSESQKRRTSMCSGKVY